MLYYPSKMGNDGTNITNAFYVNQNTGSDFSYIGTKQYILGPTIDVTLGGKAFSNASYPDPLDLKTGMLSLSDPYEVSNYNSFVLVLPFENENQDREYLQDYNLTNIMKSTKANY